MSHRTAVLTIALAAACDAGLGSAFAAAEHAGELTGLYWAVTTATTVGYGDVVPRTGAGHVIAVLVMLTVVPLFAATFSLFTSGLTEGHVDRAETRLKAHTEERLLHHLGGDRDAP